MENKNEIADLVKMGIVLVHFTKLNGEDRFMRCSLNSKFLPERVTTEVTPISEAVEKATLTVYDVDKNDWRAFRFDSVKSAVLQEAA